MCLHIDSTIHSLNANSIGKPFIATRDILVWKVLDDVGKTGGNAPFRGCRWKFGKARVAPKMRKSISVYGSLDVGLHAVLSRSAARNISGWFYRRRVCPAIIPKGSQLFFGRKRDIVATKMIVYPDLAAVEAKHGPIAAKVPRKNLVVS